jgi:dynein heavy chain 1, cytosolic
MMESMVTSPASPSNGVATGGVFPTVDPEAILNHLAGILDITLGASRKDLEKPGSLLSKGRLADTTARVTRFATESQVALYIQKDALSADGLDGVIDGSSSY